VLHDATSNSENSDWIFIVRSKENQPKPKTKAKNAERYAIRLVAGSATAMERFARTSSEVNDQLG
jgi:hypothetical protein